MIARRFATLALGSLGTVWLLSAPACVGDSTVNPGPDATNDVASGGDTAVTDTGTTDTGTTDTGSDVADTGPVDAGPPCDPTKPFDAPVNEGTTVNTALVEDGARLSPNGLELFLTRQDSIGKRINRYSRTDLSSPWTGPTVQATLVVTPPSPPASMSLALDPPALTAYVSIFTGSIWQIYLTGRNSVGADWSTPVAVPGISSSGATDEQPWINPTGNRLYFMSSRAGTYHIYVATKSGANFGTPVVLDANQTTEDRWPVLSSDELTLYYGAYDSTNGVIIYKKTRSSIGGTWSTGAPETALNGTGLNSGSITSPTSLSTDACEIYFVSNRTGGSGGLDVWHARKPK